MPSSTSEREPTPPSKLNPDIDPLYEKIIIKLMQKEPLARYQSAFDVLEEMGVAAYIGAVPYLTNAESLISLTKISSVEARHAASIRDLLAPTSFAPASVDPGVPPSEVLAVLDPYIRNTVSLINVPA